MTSATPCSWEDKSIQLRERRRGITWNTAYVAILDMFTVTSFLSKRRRPWNGRSVTRAKRQRRKFLKLGLRRAHDGPPQKESGALSELYQNSSSSSNLNKMVSTCLDIQPKPRKFTQSAPPPKCTAPVQPAALRPEEPRAHQRHSP